MSILDEIVVQKRNEIESMANVVNVQHCDFDFTVWVQNKPLIIAEIKAKSPSERIIAKNFDPISQAKAYRDGGANAISVLTDHVYFGGSFDILDAVSKTTTLPLLCKEFILDTKQVKLARVKGASLVLLIVKILDDDALKTLKEEIESLGMKALIEVQNEEETERALKIGAELLLINNRNLTSFEVDMNTTTSLLNMIPSDTTVIAASGIQAPREIKTFPERVDGFLIGTALMRSNDPAAFLKACR